MSGNNFEFFVWFSQHNSCSVSNITVGRTMKPVTADFIFLIKLVWYSIQVCPWRHFYMEGSIENTNLRSCLQMFFCSLNTFNVRRIMKRRQFNIIFECFHNLFSNQNRTAKCFASMNNTMTYSVYLFFVLYYAMIRRK